MKLKLVKLQVTYLLIIRLKYLPHSKLSLLQQVSRAVQMFLTTSGKDQVDYIVLTIGTAMIMG